MVMPQTSFMTLTWKSNRQVLFVPFGIKEETKGYAPQTVWQDVQDLDLQEKKWWYTFGNECGQNSYLQNVNLQKKCIQACLETKIGKIFTIKTFLL